MPKSKYLVDEQRLSSAIAQGERDPDYVGTTITSEDQHDASSLERTIGTRIARLRAQRGLKSVDLAHAAGVAAAYMWRVEQGRQNMTIRTLDKIAGALGVSISDLLAGIGIHEPTALRHRTEQRSLTQRGSSSAPVDPSR